MRGRERKILKCIPTTADAVNFVDTTVLCLLGKVVSLLFLFFSCLEIVSGKRFRKPLQEAVP